MTDRPRSEPRTAAGRALLEAMHSDSCDPPCLSYLQAAADRAPFADLVTAIEEEAVTIVLPADFTAGEAKDVIDHIRGSSQRTEDISNAQPKRSAERVGAGGGPGLPSSFPVGSVSGSPHGAHAYNVREEE